MEDDYVETSDQDELEESKGLFYQLCSRGQESESSRKAKRRKISHVFENANEERGSTSSPPSRYEECSPAKPRVSFEQETLFPECKSQSSETDHTESFSTLFEDLTESGAETPLTFPLSEDGKTDGHDENEPGDNGTEDEPNDWEMSQDPLDLIEHEDRIGLPSLPPSSASQILSSEHIVKKDADDLLNFHNSPEILPVLDRPPSPPLERSQIPDPLSLSSLPLPRSIRSVSPVFQLQGQNTDGDAELAHALHEDGTTSSKRNLRKRGEHQRRPYTFDKLIYMRQMKDVPEALVTARHLENESRAEREQRRRDGYLSEDESQEQTYRPPSDLEEESQIPEERVEPMGPSVASGIADELLPSMSETSDEEMRDLRQEARRLEKEKRKKERELKRAEKEIMREGNLTVAEKERRVRIKSFPVRDKEQGTDNEKTNLVEPRNATPGPANRRHVRSPSLAPEPESSTCPQPSVEPNEGEIDISILKDWKSDSPFHGDIQTPSHMQSSNGQFDDDGAVGFGPGSTPSFLSSPSSPPLSVRSTLGTAADSGLDDDSDDDSSSPDSKEKRQLKTLGRLYPRFMLPAFGVNSNTRSSSQGKEPKPRQSSRHVSTDDDDDGDDGLRPGIARIRVRKGNSKPVKGDTESEDDKGSEKAPMASDSHPHSYAQRSLSFSGFSNQQNLRIRRSVQSHTGKQQKQEIIEMSSSSSAGSSTDETDVDDEEIADFLQRSADSGRPAFKPSRKNVRTELLIDYMLARNVHFGGSTSKEKGRQRTKATGPGGLHMSTIGVQSSSMWTPESKGSQLKFSYSDHSSSPGSHRLNVVRAGQTGGRQSLLSFKNHHQVREPSENRVLKYDGSKNSEDGEDEDEDDENEEDAEDAQMHSHEEKLKKKSEKKLTWKQKLKQRKETQRMHGVYTHVADPGTRLLATNAGDPGALKSSEIHARARRKGSAAKRTAKNSKKTKRKGLWKDLGLDVHNEKLFEALAPPTFQHRPPQFISESTSTKPQPTKSINDTRERDVPPRSISADTDFALFSPGKTFGFNTYIKRGLLFELLQLIHSTPLQSNHTSASACDLIRNPSYASYKVSTLNLIISLSKPLSDFIRDLPVLCQSLGDFITGLPDVDEEVVAREWKILMRGVEEVLTGFLKSQEEEMKAKLLDTVSEAVGYLITQMRAADFIKSTIDMMTLDVCWFTIEVLLRAGFTASSSKLLSDAFRLLVQYLLEVDPGIRDAMALLRNQNPAERELNDTTSVVQREAELWVCLIHVLRPIATDGPIREHPLWELARKELERRSSTAPRWTLQANETIWQTVAGLCALSQFSEHGLCKDKPSLPESWKTVSFGLKNVQLKVDPDADPLSNSASLRIKDRYFAFIVRRCFLLVNRWDWAIESSFPVLNVISGAFGTRKFRNLLHEKADFPEFLKTQRWESCFEYTRRDSAFVLFVKLVVQRGIALKQSNKPYGMEKNLTLITPLSSVKAFSKADPPQGNELSMLYNRMAATAVRLHFLPSNFRSRVQQARQYFNFQTSDDTSRMACIRSLMYVTQLMILEKLPLEETEVKAWYIEITEVLIKEYKELSGKEERSLNRVRFLLNAVLGSLRHILNAYNDPGMGAQYPDLSFLDVIQKIGREAGVTDNAQSARELGAVIHTFLSLRDRAVAHPKFPPIEDGGDGGGESHESQDSQEYGDVDIDMDDPALDALLGGPTLNEGDNEPSPDIELKDRTVGKSLGPLTWLLYRCLKNIIEELPNGRRPSPQYMKNVDNWIDTWMQCASVAILHSQSMTWFSLCLDVRDTWRGISDIHWRRRIDIRVALNILKRTPMFYSDIKLKDYFIETLFYALIPIQGQVTVEHEFLSWILTIDGLRHPLLRNLPVTLPPHPEILAISEDTFVPLRDKLLLGLLDNTERSLRDEENQSGDRIVLGDNVVNQKFGDFLAKFFSSLKDMYLSIPEGSKEREDYKTKCKEVGTMTFEDHPRIGTWRRMAIWDAWWRGLN
ncbi:Mus7/MMS22 family-domain-containing protein [Lentinula detonsa]|uniref:Mus7/MMS22 family-domain-containing protein n=1 Tax=Lentinula detonsa TaxID=2804962 RepID=A0AA38PZR9_9AGAR|nr:Mus7/MMS22 family-domain-containing protein [Lentinula detonsa]